MEEYSDNTFALKKQIQNCDLIQHMGGRHSNSIEEGYFVFCLMPSLKCSLNCPHCYIEKSRRRSNEIVSLSNLELACKKIDQYYDSIALKNKVIIFYWFGGEPTEMGLDYFSSAVEILSRVFLKEKGYLTRHSIITSLVNVDTSIWFDFFKQHFDSSISTSYDGLMRGKGYVQKWEKKVRLAVSAGLKVGTLSTMNSELVRAGPIKVMDYLIDLGVEEVAFLPFILSIANDLRLYEKYVATMNEWSDFMIGATEYYFSKKAKGEWVPEIGQMNHILSKYYTPGITNAVAQTLQLYPNGDITMNENADGYTETVKVLGNLLSQDFGSILKSKERLSFLKRQLFKANIKECQDCEHADKCVMEVWKQNRANDDCFGGKRYIEWLLNYIKTNKLHFNGNIIRC